MKFFCIFLFSFQIFSETSDSQKLNIENVISNLPLLFLIFFSVIFISILIKLIRIVFLVKQNVEKVEIENSSEENFETEFQNENINPVSSSIEKVILEKISMQNKNMNYENDDEFSKSEKFQNKIPKEESNEE